MLFRSGLSSFHYRPFTLEGNFLAMEAVHEMLLQSHGGVIRLFPAVPTQWKNAAFERLRAEGGFEVTAERRDGRVVSWQIRATVAGTLRLADPSTGRIVEHVLGAGQSVTARTR